MAKQIQDINTNTKQSVGTNGSSADWTNLVSELTKEYGTFSETAPSSSDGLGDTKSTYGICPSKKVWTNIDSVLSESDFVVNGSYSDNQLVDIDDVAFSYKNPTISISSSSMSFAAVGEAKTVTVTLAHVPDNTYSVTCADSWVTISKSGTTVTLTIAKNTGNARSTTVTFSCNGRANTTSASTTLSVSQSAASISLSNTSSTVSYKAQNVSTTVTSSYGWTLSGVPNWLTTSKSSGNSGDTVTFTTTKNTSADQRSCTITFTCGTKTKTLSIVQLGYPSISLGATSGSITPAAQTKNVTVSYSNLNYYTVTSNAAWATVPSGNQTGSSFNISASKNSSTQRQATITVQGYDHDGSALAELKKTYTLTQTTGVTTISVNPTSLSFTPEAADKTATVTYANTSGYSVSSNQSWCTVSKSGNTVTVSATKNAGGQRTATVTITATAGTYDEATPKCTIAVSQSSGVTSFSVSPDTISLTSNAAASKSFTVSQTNVSSWRVLRKPRWVTVDTTNKTISITKNTGSDRSGTISFSATGTYDGATKTDSITVTQEGISAIAFDPTSLSFTPAAASKTLYVNKTNIKTVTVSSNQTWCTLTKSTGTDTKDTYTVAVTKNTGSARSCTITATGTGDSDGATRTITLTVSQSSGVSSFSVSPDTISLTSNAAASKSFTVSQTNVSSWSVLRKPRWVTVDTTNKTISITKNTGSDRSGTISFSATGTYDDATRTDSIAVTQEGISVLDLKPDAGLSFTPAAGSGTIYAEKTNLTSATVSDNADWCTLTKTTGTNAKDTYTVEVTKNTGSARSCTITATGTGDSDSTSRTDTITVSQSSGVSSFSVSPDTISLTSNAAASKSFTVSATNVSSWSVSSKPDWVTVDTTNKTISITKNTGSDRSGTIRFSATGTYDGATRTDSIAVSQEGISAINVTPDAGLSFAPAANTGTIYVNKTNLKTATVSSNQTWCTLTKTTGTDTKDTYTVSVTKNTGSARSCTITATGTGSSDSVSRTDTITISQSSGVSSMTVKNSSGTALSSGHDVGGTYAAISSAFTVTTVNTGNWTATSGATWCTLNKTSGSSGASFTISAAKNTGNARNTTVTVTSTGTYDSKTHTFTFDVSQASGKSVITVTPASKTFTHAAQNDTVTVSLTNATGYNVSSNQSWCTVSNNSNKITVAEYYSATSSNRSATVTFTAAGTVDGASPTDTVTVTQSPSAYLSANLTTWSSVPATGGNKSVKITTYNCTGFSVRDGLPSWLTATVSGDYVSLTVAENETTSARSHTVYFDTVGGADGSSDYHYITVSQLAGTITYGLEVNALDDITSIKVNETTALRANYYAVINGVRKANANVTNSAYTTWTTSSSTNATVSKATVATVTGVKGKDDGTTDSVAVTITATYNGYSDSITVNVSDNITYGLDVTPDSGNTVQVGSTLGLTAKYYTMINGARRSSLDSTVTTNSSTTWKSNKTANATVSKGTVTGVKGKDDGTTTAYNVTITATYSGKSDSVTVGICDVITYELDVIPDSGNTLPVGSTYYLQAIYYTKINGTRSTSLYTNVTFDSGTTWKSNKTANATVNTGGGVTNGRVTGVKGKGDGTTDSVAVTITATYNGYSDSTIINVYDNITYGLEVTCSDTSIKVGENTNCSAKYYTKINGTRKTSLDQTVTTSGACTWTSNKTSNATVTAGVVIGVLGKNDGTSSTVSVTITATYNGYSDYINVVVSDVITYGLDVTPDSGATVKVGSTVSLTAKYYTKINGTRKTSLDQTVTTNSGTTWTSDYPTYASVNRGVVTGVMGKNDGTTDAAQIPITATYNGYSDTVNVGVCDTVTYGLVLSGATSVNAGSSITLTPTYVTYINGTRKTSLDNTNISCTWTSSNTNIATVSGGVVTGKAAKYGSVTITAKYGATYTATHTVQVNYSYSYFEITPSDTELDVTTNYGASTIIGSKLYTVTNGSTTSSRVSAKNVTFTSSNTTLANVEVSYSSATLKANAAQYGTVTITGAYSGYSATCTITIHYTFESFVVIPSSATIKVGQTIDLSGEWVTTADGVETRTVIAASDITWSTNMGSSYFEVNSGGVAGRVKGLKKSWGNAFDVTGAYNSKDADCAIKVDEVATPSISASPTSVSGTYSGGTYTSTIILTNVTSYTASCTAGWVTLSKGAVSSGKSKLTVTLAANTSTSGRSATISLSCSNDDGSATATIIVGQTGKPEPYIDVTPTTVTFGASSYSQQTFTVTQTGSSFSLDSSQTKPSWLTTSISGNKLYITPNSANTSTTARTGYVYLKGNDGATTTSSGASCRIYVTQSGATTTATLTVSPTAWSAPSTASSKTFTVKSDNSNWTIESYPNWITLSGRTGTGATFSMSANTTVSLRSGSIVFKHATTTSLTKSVSVLQSGVTHNKYPFKLVSTSSSIDINGGTLYVQDSSTSSPVDNINFEGSLISSSSTVTIDNFTYQSSYAMSELAFNNLYFWLEIGVPSTAYTYKFYVGNTQVTSAPNTMSTLKFGDSLRRWKVSDFWTYSEYTSSNIKLRIEREGGSSSGGGSTGGRATFSNTSGWTTDNTTLTSRGTYPNVPQGYSIAGSNIAGVGNGIAKARINISGYTGSYTVKLVSGLTSNSIEKKYDYGVIGKLDTDLSSTNLTGGNSATLPSTVLAWTWNAMECSYTFNIPNTSSHFIDVYYRKDSGGNAGDDCVYCLYQNNFA